MLANAFDCGDLLAFATGSEHRAREHGRAVNQNRASSAGGIVAAALGAGELQVHAQCVEQESIRLDGDLVGATVNA